MRISYARLVNLGNYENERVEVEDEAAPGESPEELYRRVRRQAYALLGIRDPEAESAVVDTAAAAAGDDEVPF